MNRRLSVLLERGIWLAGIVVVLLLATALIVRPDLRGTVNDNQGAVSVVLTAMLVLLYFGQYRVQNRQLRFEQAAPVQIQRHEVNANQIDVWLSNTGNGPANKLELEACIDFSEVNEFGPGCASTKLRRVDENGDFKRRVGNTLQAGEHYVRFQGEPKVGMDANEGYSGWGLKTATSRLAEEGVEEVELEFYVTNEDLLGNMYREKLVDLSSTIELRDSGVNIEEAKGRRISKNILDS